MMTKVIHDTDIGATHQVIDGKLELNPLRDEDWHDITAKGSDGFNYRISHPFQMRKLDDPTESGNADDYKVRQYLFPLGGYDAPSANKVYMAVKAVIADIKDNYLSKGFHTGNVQFGLNGGVGLSLQQDGNIGIGVPQMGTAKSDVPWMFSQSTQGTIPLLIDKFGVPLENILQLVTQRISREPYYLNLKDGASFSIEFATPLFLWELFIQTITDTIYSRPDLVVDINYADNTTISKALLPTDYHWYGSASVFDYEKRVKSFTVRYQVNNSIINYSPYALNTNTGKLVNALTTAGLPDPLAASYSPVIQLDYVYVYEANNVHKAQTNLVDITSLFTASTTNTAAQIASGTAITNLTTNNVAGFGVKAATTAVNIQFTANDPMNAPTPLYIEIDLDSSAANRDALNNYLSIISYSRRFSAQANVSSNSRGYWLNGSAASSDVLTMKITLTNTTDWVHNYNVLLLVIARQNTTPISSTANFVIKAVRIFGEP